MYYICQCQIPSSLCTHVPIMSSEFFPPFLGFSLYMYHTMTPNVVKEKMDDL